MTGIRLNRKCFHRFNDDLRLVNNNLSCFACSVQFQHLVRQQGYNNYLGASNNRDVGNRKGAEFHISLGNVTHSDFKNR